MAHVLLAPCGGVIFFFLKDFIDLVLQRWEGERERNINVWLLLMCPLLGTWPTTQACALTGNRTGDPLVHSPALTPLSHTSQGHFLVHLFMQCIAISGSSFAQGV